MTQNMLAALDLEIASEVEGNNWHSQGPLGIACLGWAEKMASDLPVKYGFWEGSPRLKKEQCVKIVHELMELTANGRWCIVTVNGAAFDWRVLAEESGMKAECVELAMNHCDLTAMFLCKFGWPVGLAALAESAGTFKAHTAVLRDGSEVEISGAMAPKLWKNGEHEAVLGYMKQDCIATVTTAAVGLSRGYVGYVSKSGKPYRVTLPTGPNGVYLPSLRECLSWPAPDTSWMSAPIARSELTDWMIVNPKKTQNLNVKESDDNEGFAEVFCSNCGKDDWVEDCGALGLNELGVIRTMYCWRCFSNFYWLDIGA